MKLASTTARWLFLLSLVFVLSSPDSPAQTSAFKVDDNSSNNLLNLNTDAGFLLKGTFGTGTIPTTGSGTRLMWHPAKAAFRAGAVSGTQWDDGSIGNYSTAMGYNTVASGTYSIAMGNNTTASGSGSTAMGYSTYATGPYSTTMGQYTNASGSSSTAFGYGTTASGSVSTAMGSGTTAIGSSSTAMGSRTTASGSSSSAM